MKPASRNWRFFWLLLSCLVLPLTVLFHSSFQEGQTLFANDGPLGAVVAQAGNASKTFFGHWEPLNWIGYPEPNALPNITMSLFFSVGRPRAF